MYNPDRWVILKITENDTNNTLYRVLAGWSGGYLDGDAWRLNSGIVRIEEIDEVFDVHGYSGSVYRCHKNYDGFTALMAHIVDSWEENIKDTGTIEVIDIKDIMEMFK